MSAEKGKVSLAIAKRLKEAGYPQDKSEKVWRKNCEGEYYYDYRRGGEIDCKALAAPTPTELGEVLPTLIENRNNRYGLGVMRDSLGVAWYVVYTNRFLNHYYCPILPQIPKESLADAMGEMVIYLLKKGIIKAETDGTD